MTNRFYKFHNSEQQIIISERVLDVFATYRQVGLETEAGGLLFAEFDLPLIHIVEVSLPHRKDQRWRTLFVPDRMLQRQIIKQRFKNKIHFIGEWHTHPEVKPTPSILDLESMADSFKMSRHELNWFIMIIVGNSPKKLVLSVTIHDGLNYHSLKEINSLNHSFPIFR